MKAIRGSCAILLLILVCDISCKAATDSASSNTNQMRQKSVQTSNYRTSPVAAAPTGNTEYVKSVELFKSKIADRLEESVILARQPDMKSRLMSVALDKFRSCEISENPMQLHGKSYKSCLGTQTAQMMSLIRAYEKTQNEGLLDAADPH